MKTSKLILLLCIFIGNAFAYELTQESIYCQNTINQKLNCNYQLGEGSNIFETSVSLTGLAQYVIQKSNGNTIYAKHLIRKGVKGLSFQITEDKTGKLSKLYVEFIKPTDISKRPFFASLRVRRNETQQDFFKDVQNIKDIISKFNPAYQVKTENSSAKQ